MTRLLLMALLAAMASAHAHELPDNRVTLVLRDATHLSLTGLIDYPAALNQALAPQQSAQEFAVRCAAMTPAEFQQGLNRAHDKFKAGILLTLPSGEALTFTHWRWPEAAGVQARLRERAMRAVVGGPEAGHLHEPPLEIHAEASAAQPLAAVRTRLPREFGPVLLVSYRPHQTWLEPQGAAVLVGF